MLERGLDDGRTDFRVTDLCVTQMGVAIERADLEAARRGCQALKAGLSGLTQTQLLALRKRLESLRDLAADLRDAYAHDLRGTVRGRQSINAYRDGVRNA